MTINATNELPVSPTETGEPDMPQPQASETAARSSRIEFGGVAYDTNLPEGVNPYGEASHVRQAKLLPNELDKLQLGNYFVSTTETDPWADVPKEREVRHEINIIDGERGKTVNTGASNLPWTLQEGTAELMRVLGYVVEEKNGVERIVAFPTPETVKSAAQLVGVDIEFFPDDEFIPGAKYLGAYADGKYPVSTKEIDMYKHDIEDDHLTAMVLGGEPLKNALAEVATQALHQGAEAIDGTARRIDVFTATLRAVIRGHGNLQGEAYGAEQGRKTLHEEGTKMGLNHEVVETILTQAQEIARQLDLEPTKLQ
jgi:hypothetical protein